MPGALKPSQMDRNPATAWFNVPITRDSPLAPVPGTADAYAMSLSGRIGIPQARTIVVVHFHFDHPAGTGTYALELYRRRAGVNLLIATISSTGALGDFGTENFTFVDNAYKELEAWDYLLLQPTSVMTGAGAKLATGFVDVHYDSTQV